MIEKWQAPKKVRLRTWFSSKVKFTHAAIKQAITQDTWKGDCCIYAYNEGEEPELAGATFARRNIKNVIIFEVYESDEIYWGPQAGLEVDLVNYRFAADEIDLAVKCFMKLAKCPLKKKRDEVPPFIFFSSI